MRTDDLDAVKSKLYEESEPFLSAHPNYDISTDRKSTRLNSSH